MASVAIDEGTHPDRWFITCAQAANVTLAVYYCFSPQIDTFVDALFSGVGCGVLHFSL
jgi:hypothetical protein